MGTRWRERSTVDIETRWGRRSCGLSRANLRPVPVELRLALAFAVAGGAAAALTPLAERVARRTAFLDRPVGYKGHGTPTPYLGGVAVVSAFLIGSLAGAGPSELWPLLGGALVLCALGTLDDTILVVADE